MTSERFTTSVLYRHGAHKGAIAETLHDVPGRSKQDDSTKASLLAEHGAARGVDGANVWLAMSACQRL